MEQLIGSQLSSEIPTFNGAIDQIVDSNDLRTSYPLQSSSEVELEIKVVSTDGEMGNELGKQLDDLAMNNNAAYNETNDSISPFANVKSSSSSGPSKESIDDSIDLKESSAESELPNVEAKRSVRIALPTDDSMELEDAVSDHQNVEDSVASTSASTLDLSNVSKEREQSLKRSHSHSTPSIDVECAPIKIKKVKIKPKNIDKTYYAKSASSQTCKLCPVENKSGSSMVDHYLEKHRKYEVYCSRLKADVAEKVRKSKSTSIGQCIFCCEPHKDYSHEQWLKHYSQFTGEYMFRCKKHGKTADDYDCRGCKDVKTKSKYWKMRQNEIRASICNECNFIQFSESKIVQHLRNEHELVGIDRLRKKFCTRITLRRSEERGCKQGKSDHEESNSEYGSSGQSNQMESEGEGVTKGINTFYTQFTTDKGLPPETKNWAEDDQTDVESDDSELSSGETYADRNESIEFGLSIGSTNAYQLNNEDVNYDAFRSLFVPAEYLYLCICKFNASSSTQLMDHLKEKHFGHFECVHCGTLIKIQTEDADFTSLVSKHLSMHAIMSGSFDCTRCYQMDLNAIEIILHYHQQHEDDILELKPSSAPHEIVEGKLICCLCQNQYSNAARFERHFVNRHPHCVVGARIAIQNFEPDAALEKTNIYYRQQYKCAEKTCGLCFPTKNELIEHHDLTHYDNQHFEFRITPPLVYPLAADITENDLIAESGAFLLSCPNDGCEKLLFGSMFAVKKHVSTHLGGDNFRFSHEKLFRCIHCPIVGTIDGLFSHFGQNHPDSSLNVFLLRDAIDAERCAGCNYHISDDFVEHYDQHDSFRYLTEDMLLQLNPLEMQVDYLLMSCCVDGISFQWTQIDPRELIEHVTWCAEIDAIDDLLELIVVVFKNGFSVKAKHLAKTFFGETLKNLFQTDKIQYEDENDNAELLKQSELRKNLCIVGLPQSKNERLFDHFMKICSLLGVGMPSRNVLDVERVSKNCVIIQLKDFNDKKRILRESKMKELWLSDVVPNASESSQIFINNQCTPFFRNLETVARRAVNKNLLHSYWVSKHGFMVKTSKFSKVVHIKNERDLQLLIDGLDG